MKPKLIVVLSLLAMATSAAAQPSRPAHTAAQIEPLLAKIAKYEHGQSREPVAEFTLFMEESLSSPALVKQLETRLGQFLRSNATVGGKELAFRELSLIATDASIPLLSEMLTQAPTSEMARFVLARIPGAAADDTLRAALTKSSGGARIGIINSLGSRRDVRAVAVLQPLLSNADPGLSAAAASALSQIANQPALDALAAARLKASGVPRQRISEAYLFCASRFAERGDTTAALKVYNELRNAQEPVMIRIAALNGLTAHDAKNAIPVLTAELGSSHSGMQAAAVRLLSGLSGPEVTSALVQQFPKLPPPVQVRLLTVLAARGDAAGRPVLVEAIKSSSADVRTSALSGLGTIGDAQSVTLLAEAAAASQGAQQEAARNSLRTMRGTAIDQAIATGLQSSSGKVKAELILAAGERVAAGAAEVVTKSASDSDPDVRREALRALKNLAGPAQTPALLDLVVRSPGPADRREAVQALAAVLKKSEPVRAEPVIAAYKSSNDTSTRLALMEVMGLISSEESLPLLRAGLKDSSPEIARGAILALTQWSSPAPREDLLAVARSETNPGLQILGLRGYLKLLGLPAGRPAATEGAKMLAEAWRLSKQTTEKQAVLSQLPAYPSKEALDLAQAAVSDENVAKEAKAAVDRLNVLLKVQ